MNSNQQMELFPAKKKLLVKATQKKKKVFELKYLQKRYLAFFVDFVIVNLMISAFSGPGFKFFYMIGPYLNREVRKEFWYSLWNLNTLMTMLVFVSYYTLSHYLGHGKSLGKILFNLKVTNDDFSHLSFGKAFLRGCVYALSLTYFPFFLAVPLINRERRSITDFFFDQRVLTENEFDSYKTQFWQEQLHWEKDVAQLPLEMELMPVAFRTPENIHVITPIEGICPLVTTVADAQAKKVA